MRSFDVDTRKVQNEIFFPLLKRLMDLAFHDTLSKIPVLDLRNDEKQFDHLQLALFTLMYLYTLSYE